MKLAEGAAPSAASATRFGGIQAMRGVAACMVMAGHSLNGFFPLYDRIFPSGVDIFFVISGFIISYSASTPSNRGRPSNTLRFALHRVIRIFPLYLIVLTCAVATSFRVPFCHDNLTLANIVLDAPTSCLVTPSWTLCFEVQFYAFVAIVLLVAPRHIFPAIAILMLPTILVRELDLPINTVITNPLVLEFGLGATIAYLTKRNIKAFSAIAAILSVGFFAAGAAIATGVGSGAVNGIQRVVTYGFGSALLIYAVVGADLRGIKFPKLAQYIGDASYSIYIWHILLIIWWWAAIEPKLSEWLSGYSLIVLQLIFILATTLVFYQCLERPMLRFMRRRFLSAGPRRTNVTADVIGTSVTPLISGQGIRL